MTGEVLVQPGAGLLVHRLAAGVDEAHVHDAPAGAEVGEVLEAVDEPGRREPVHHVELGVLGHVTPRASAGRPTVEHASVRRAAGHAGR